MKIILLKSFVATGFKIEVNNNVVEAMDSYGNKLREGIDFIIEEKENPLIEIIQANGLHTYEPIKN